MLNIKGIAPPKIHKISPIPHISDSNGVWESLFWKGLKTTLTWKFGSQSLSPWDLEGCRTDKEIFLWDDPYKFSISINMLRFRIRVCLAAVFFSHLSFFFIFFSLFFHYFLPASCGFLFTWMADSTIRHSACGYFFLKELTGKICNPFNFGIILSIKFLFHFFNRCCVFGLSSSTSYVLCQMLRQWI